VERTPMDCPLRSGHDLADRYVAGTLSEAEQDAFEQHFFACAACLAHVQQLQDIRDGLRESPAPAAASRPASPSFGKAPWLGLALAASVVAAFGWWWQRASVPTPGQPIADGRRLPGASDPPSRPASPSTPTPPATAPVEGPVRRTVLAQLALVVPPRYVPITVRGGSGPPAGTFDAAMAHYVAGRYRESAAALQALSEATPADPGIAFFWGISELMLRRPDAAREGLTRAVSADVQPYADEAHFYLAKVHLAQGAVDLARRELQYAVEHEAGPEGEAQRILAALDRLPR
jgi:hypothetical protein